MEKTRKITTILTLAVAFCFVLASLAQADKKSAPIWQITQDGTPKSVEWVDHVPNPRFAIYDPGTPEDNSDDLVLDKETGLVWARDANWIKTNRPDIDEDGTLGDGKVTWEHANTYCRTYVVIGNRRGWRLPTVDELASLVDPLESDPALPSGYPFINVQPGNYWSSTTYEGFTALWGVDMSLGYVGDIESDDLYVWPVRGGSGPILVLIHRNGLFGYWGHLAI